jgi:multidrug efflux pump subunit AcrA (membrane-fusion protein)
VDTAPPSPTTAHFSEEDVPQALIEARLWAAFATADTADAVQRSWLALLCRRLPGACAGVLLRAEPGGAFAPVAVWPNPSRDFGHLRAVAEECISSGHPAVRADPTETGPNAIHIAYPFFGAANRLAGAIVLELTRGSEDLPRDVVRAVHLAVGWMEAQALRDSMEQDQGALERTSAALDIVTVANEHERPDAAAMAVASELTLRLPAARVAIGLRPRRRTRLLALSHTAWFRRTALANAFETAMDEAADQRATVRLPAIDGEPVRITAAHAALRALWCPGGSIVTVPLLTRGEAAGALILMPETDRREGFTRDQIRLAEAAAAMLGPVLLAKWKARRFISGRGPDAVRHLTHAVAGPRHTAWKLGLGAAALAIAAAALVPTTFRVSARAVLEGEVQRAAPAPFDGFIATAPARAGDVVRAGDVLATLNDTDLQLDRARWLGERDQARQKMRDALAKHDRASAGQFEAQVRQAEAQLALAEEKLARSRIVAHIDGLVVSGDLSQSLGGPVETGKVLFEIAPLDAWRVVVHVDERDVMFVRPEQHGTLLLAGMSGLARAFTMERIIAVAETDNGRNTFRGEARLDTETDTTLRPGMEGVAKIEVGTRSFLNVWTRGAVEWMRMQIWAWTP